MVALESALKKGQMEFEKLYKKAKKLINEEIKKLPANKNLNLYAGGTEKITITFDKYYPVIVIKELVKRLNADYMDITSRNRTRLLFSENKRTNFRLL